MTLARRSPAALPQAWPMSSTAIGWCTVFLALTAPAVGYGDDDTAWEYRVCRARICLSSDIALPADFLETLARRLATATGPAWTFQSMPLPPELSASAGGELRTLPAKRVIASLSGADKLVIASVRAAPRGAAVEAREFDVASESWSAPSQASAFDPTKILEAAVSAMFGALRPRAAVVHAEGDRAQLSLRGGALLAAPARWGVAPGDAFTFFLRSPDQPPRAVPLTWAVVVSGGANGAECRIGSSLKNPFAAFVDECRQHDVELIALRARPLWPRSTLALRALGAGEPLPHCDVWQTPVDAPRLWLGRTNVAGLLPLAAAPGPQAVCVTYGNEQLASLVIWPGLEKEINLAAALPQVSLANQAYLADLRNSLAEALARRELQLAEAREAVAAGRLDDAERKIAALREENVQALLSDLVKRGGSLPDDQPAARKALDAWLAAGAASLARQSSDEDLQPLKATMEKARAQAAAAKLPAPNSEASPAAEVNTEVEVNSE